MSEDLATEALLEFLNACEAGIAAAKQMIKNKKISDEDFNKLSWTTKEGSKGTYEQTTKEANRDSVLFQLLHQRLKKHGGFWQHNGFKLWFHQQDENVIDRRKT